MSIRTFIFGKPSRQMEITAQWKKNLQQTRATYNPKIASLEKVKMSEIGFPSENAPKTIDEKIRRLERLDAQINEIQDELDAEEDRLWFEMMDRLKQDQMESAGIFGRIWLWLYWHV